MANWKYGYNYDTGSVYVEKFIADAINSGSNIHLIMSSPQNGIPGKGDFDTLWHIYNSLIPHYPDLMLIWRIYSDREGNWSIFPDSKIYQTIFDSYQLPPNTIVDSFFNEPSLNGSSYMTNEQYVRHELQYLRDLKAIGVKYAVGAFSTGTPHEKMIQDGVYDKLIEEAEYWSMHLYGAFPLEAGETLPYEILNKTEENRQRIRQIYLSGEKVPQGHKGWLLLRPEWIEERAIKIGTSMPKILVTEGFVDLIDNIPPIIRSNWSNNFGIDIYMRDPRGILSWRNYIQWLFPENTFEQNLVMIMNHIRENILYQPYIVCMTLFGYNRNWGYPHGSHRFSGHNWEDEGLDLFRRIYLKIINTFEDDDMTVPLPDEPVKNQYGKLYSISVSNIRQEPIIPKDNPNSTLVFVDGKRLQLTNEKIDVIMINQKATHSSNNYKWFQFLHKNGQVYYVADTGNVIFEEVIDETDAPKYIVDLFTGTQVMTQQELTDLIDLFRELIDFVEEINEEPGEDEDGYLKTRFDAIRELIAETNDLNVQKTADLLNIIVVGLEGANKFQ